MILEMEMLWWQWVVDTKVSFTLALRQPTSIDSHGKAFGKYAYDADVGETILIFVTVADLRRLDLFLHAIAE